MRKFFFVGLALVAGAGSLKNSLALADHFYLWPLARFVGYSSLLVYSLLMLRWGRYNTRSSIEEEK